MHMLVLRDYVLADGRSTFFPAPEGTLISILSKMSDPDFVPSLIGNSWPSVFSLSIMNDKIVTVLFVYLYILPLA